MARPRQQLRAGVTFVEVICAVALVALLAAVALAGVSSILQAQERQIRRINAAELANRLVLQYLDDQDTVPAPGTILRVDETAYRFEVKRTPVMLVPAVEEVAAERAQFTPSNLDRLYNLSVLVWLAEESGGSVQPEAGVPAVRLTRIIDPIALISRNPDSLRNMMQDPEKYRRMLEQFMGPGAPRGAGEPGGGAPGRVPAAGGRPPANPSRPSPPPARPPSQPSGKGGGGAPKGKGG